MRLRLALALPLLVLGMIGFALLIFSASLCRLLFQE